MSVMNQSGDDQAECPLCMEPLEVDDLNFYPCTCGYQICRFCWNRIREGENGLCPACRKAYPENPADFTPLSQEQVAALKTEKRAKEQQKRNKSQESRKQLSTVRVVQKNLVFVVGLPVRLADPEILKRQEYFGKYGKIHKVVINHSTAYAGSQGPSASAYVTYVSGSDALRAIQNVNNVTIDGRVLKGSLGTTKYCANFMRNQPCPKPDCMYLHELGDPNASFTKEEMHQGLHQIYEKKLHNQLIAATAAAAAAASNSNNGPSTNSLVTSNNSSSSGGTSALSNSGNSLLINGNHSNNSSSSNSSSTSSLNCSGSINNYSLGGGGSSSVFIPTTVVTSSNINIHNAKMKNNSSNGSTSGGVVLSSSSSSTSSSCSRDTWPSLGSNSPPLHLDAQDSNPSPQPSINIQTTNRNISSDTGNKQQQNHNSDNNLVSSPQQTNGKNSNKNNKNNKENQSCDGTNANSTRPNSSNNKGNNGKKGNKNKSNSDKQNKGNKKDNQAHSTSNNNSNNINNETDKKKSEKDKNKNTEQSDNTLMVGNEIAFKQIQNDTMDEEIDLDADERHSLIDGHDLLEGNDRHSLLDDDDHSLLKDIPQRNLMDNSNINMLKKHTNMMGIAGQHNSLFTSSQILQQHTLPQLKDFSPLENTNREHQLLFNLDRSINNSSAFLDKEMMLFRERQQKELLIKQELLARQQLYNAMSSDPTKFLNLDPKEQLLLQQRLRQQQQQQNILAGNVCPPIGMRMDGTIPQQFGLQPQMQNQTRAMNGLINDASHLMINGVDTQTQGLVNSMSAGNLATNLNAAAGIANSLSTSSLPAGAKLLVSNSATLGSEMRYVGEDNMDRFFLDFHRNQQLKGGRTGPLLPPETHSLAFIESQALQRKYGPVQNGFQDGPGQQLSQQIQPTAGNMYPSGNINNGQMGNNGNNNPIIQQTNITNQQQQTGGNISSVENQVTGNNGGQNNREDDLDFEWLMERQKLFAELIENDMLLQQGHPNYSENECLAQRHVRPPPQGYTHMNSFGIGMPRPQQQQQIAPGVTHLPNYPSDWTQMDPAIMASGLCSNTAQQQHSLMARFRNMNLQQQQIDAHRLQNNLVLPQQQHNLLTAQQQLQYQQQQQQQRKLMAAVAAQQHQVAQQHQAAQQAAQHQQQIAQQQQQQQQQQQLPNSFWLLPTEQQMNNFQNRNGYYTAATQAIQNNGEMTQNNKYNIPMAQGFASSGNPSAECIESK